jgi:hypothetical protein
MDETDGLIFLGMITCLTAMVLMLARRVASLEEDFDLMHVAAGSPKDLLEAKRMITKRATERDIERGML